MTARRSPRRGIVAAALGTVLALAPLGAAQAAPSGPDAPTPGTQRTPASSDVAAILGAGAADAITGRYIVVFDKDTSSRAQTTARSGARNVGGKVHHTFGTALDGFSATLPAAALRALQRNPNVAYIEADRRVSITETQSPAPWGLDRIDQRNLPLDNRYTSVPSGEGVSAYILDTGIRTSHVQFGGRAVSGYTAINDGRGSSDCNGHGTHVAGSVGARDYGVAKDVRLVAVRVLDCNGSGSTSGIIAGVDWVTRNASGPSVANMSLGGGASTSLDNAVRNSIAAGITYALAAGNSNNDACGGSPGRVTEAITVGSSTRSDARSSFSSFGSCLDIFAPGSDIISTWHTGDTATNTISGTSMATPHVAGVAALYLEGNRAASPQQVRDTIVNASTPNKLSNVGSGSPNRLLYSNLGGGTDPDPTPPSGCDLPESFSGSLSGTGDVDSHPNGNYFYTSRSGTHRGCLEGPSNADFDLYLWKWNGSSWVTVAQGTSPSSTESVSYNGTAGYYVWRVESYSGSGSYTFEMQRP